MVHHHLAPNQNDLNTSAVVITTSQLVNTNFGLECTIIGIHSVQHKMHMFAETKWFA